MSKNKKVPWDDSYLLGIKSLDSQHKKAFDLLNRLYELGDGEHIRESMREILYEFSKYMKVHFKEEEAYMASINFPELEKHKKLHGEIIKNISKILNSKDNLNILKSKLKVVVKRGLVDHIIKEDMKIKTYNNLGYDKTDEELFEISNV